MKKLFIDDRRVPDADWILVTTSDMAARLIRGSMETGDFFTHISFDHDLGGDDTTVRIADMLEEFARDGKYPRVIWTIHSDNPAGRRRLTAALESADRFWDEHEAP